jgi:hypothetical protein
MLKNVIKVLIYDKIENGKTHVASAGENIIYYYDILFKANIKQ